MAIFVLFLLFIRYIRSIKVVKIKKKMYIYIYTYKKILTLENVIYNKYIDLC